MIPSTPTPQIFERLRVTDGLLIDRERWQLAHNYHRQRQNLHYQSLQQPGIVCGLGVAAISAPAEIPSTYKDDRWIELQPGIAIDLLGNPIVVPEPMPFRISSEAADDNSITVYIVLRYVDPDGLDGQANGDRVRETFRIDEVIRPPLEREVEVCRLSLSGDPIHLAPATNVFAPDLNHIDLRFRQQVRARSLGGVQVACMAHSDGSEPSCYRSANSLLQALPALYPDLEGDLPQLTQPHVDSRQPPQFDLVIADYRQLIELNSAARASLKQHLTVGGVLLVTTQSQREIGELADLEFKLEAALAETDSRDELGDIHQQLGSELQAVQADLKTQVMELRRYLEQSLDYPLASTATESGLLSRDSPLRNQPFAFGQLPPVGHSVTQLYQWRGVVLAIGDWVSAWGPDESLMLGRDCIRTAQELGVNLLNFAWRRRQLTLLQQSVASDDRTSANSPKSHSNVSMTYPT